MHNPKSPILLFALVGALLSGGCALDPAIGEVAPEPLQLVPASSSEIDLVKNTPPVKPNKDLRYQLPPAEHRALTIFIGSQSFEYVEGDQVFLSGPVSTGTKEHPTPTGDFRVLSKDIDKRSGKYTNYFNDNTPMPYSLQFHGPYFVHEGWVPTPTVPDSHGCIRLRTEDARLLFDRIRIGDRILVKGSGAARLASVSPNHPTVF
ncbi:L,D-transpeptidase [uncultured Thiodictyon sp.]|uniref:L,D-transpeptidase n=1 Tax=uncultured Thiodictyon sp. TaxID=1846217 RepID=UPI0025FF7A46|nr:L,D-transpeptidase [uncultured Thiodictyon sp.]